MFRRYCRGLRGGQKGFTFIEVLVGMLLLSAIVAAFLMAIATAFKANMVAQVRTTADSLARAQMEYIKSQDFADEYLVFSIPEDKSAYTIWYDPDEDIEDDEINGTDSGKIGAVNVHVGMQKIMLLIKHNDIDVLRLEQYKTER
ncbi:MAG: prepilin-type N-terminal cleavage/methylation domain-containing protein [Dehalococcoidaceae bacterium]|nr:prepilin-type N-terminal cleavage/methylation domain-containing protein [Dehalococcoidaceae bacterium]